MRLLFGADALVREPGTLTRCRRISSEMTTLQLEGDLKNIINHYEVLMTIRKWRYGWREWLDMRLAELSL